MYEKIKINKEEAGVGPSLIQKNKADCFEKNIEQTGNLTWCLGAFKTSLEIKQI